jgi:hypothetical protein
VGSWHDDCSSMDDWTAPEQVVSDGTSIASITQVINSSNPVANYNISKTVEMNGDFEITLGVTLPAVAIGNDIYYFVPKVNFVNPAASLNFNFSHDGYMQSRKMHTSGLISSGNTYFDLPYTGEWKLKKTDDQLYVYVDDVFKGQVTVDRGMSVSSIGCQWTAYWEFSGPGFTWYGGKLNDILANYSGGLIEVWTPADLDNVRNDLTASYIQMADIDLSGFENWIPIGVWDLFSGKYNINNFTISNMTCNTIEEGCPGGLFATLDNEFGVPEIKNGTFINCSVVGWENQGILAGMSYAKVANCHSDDTCSVRGLEWVGGLIGEQAESWTCPDGEHLSDLIDCHSDASVSSQSGGAGGLVGSLSNYYSENCYATGPVQATEEGNGSVGGLFGNGGDWKTCTLKKCYATGPVQGGQQVGGLIGTAVNMITENCYATGPVQGIDEVGGFFGRYEDEQYPGSPDMSLPIGSFSNCYSVGPVDGETNVGGFIGSKEGNDTPGLDSCYYDSQTSFQSDNDGRGIPKTTEEMKTRSTYEGWNFGGIWAFDWRPDVL